MAFIALWLPVPYPGVTRGFPTINGLYSNGGGRFFVYVLLSIACNGCVYVIMSKNTNI